MHLIPSRVSLQSCTMKIVLISLLFVAAACAEVIENPAYGYLVKYGIPQAERILEAEEAYHKSPESRIVGGVPAALGQYPYQVTKSKSYKYSLIRCLPSIHPSKYQLKYCSHTTPRIILVIRTSLYY